MAVIEMMKVKLATGRVGHKFNERGEQVGEFFQNAGDEVEMPTSEANRYLERGMASRIVEVGKK